MINKLIIASAGSGKTTHLINKAIEEPNQKILITTFTEANEKEIKAKFISLVGCIPKNVTIITWFSFLIRHGAKPYQGGIHEKKISGLILAEGRSGLKYKVRGRPVYFSEDKEFERFYFNLDGRIYSDKLAKFVLKCDDYHYGAVIKRLTRVYDKIFVDEIQDLAGYDLEILTRIFDADIELTMVGDPRQGTYSTSNSAKNKKFARSLIVEFFELHKEKLEIDDVSFKINHRCSEEICTISNALYPEFEPAVSGNDTKTGHDGIFLIRPEDVGAYVDKFSVVQLRYDKRTKVVDFMPVFNYGGAKGLTFKRTLLYPSSPLITWLKNNNAELALTSRAKLYVALTRAEQSVAIVQKYDKKLSEIFTYYE